MDTYQANEPWSANEPMTRRKLLALAASTTVAGALLAACGQDDDGAPDPAADRATNLPPGVDVSNFGGVIDWSAVRASGQQFAMVHATEGDNVVDDQFAANWSGSQAVGVLRGAYHILQPGADGVAQAQHFLSTVGADLGQLPPAVDVELGSPAYVELQAWLDAVQQATGIKPMIRTTIGFGDDELAGFGAYPLWIADFESSTSPTLPAGWETWLIWHHSMDGVVAGIDGDVDLLAYAGPLPG